MNQITDSDINSFTLKAVPDYAAIMVEFNVLHGRPHITAVDVRHPTKVVDVAASSCRPTQRLTRGVLP